MRKPTLIKQTLLGLLLGIFIMPAQPAQAQWTVFDPTSYAAQIEEMAREADRWMRTIQHYTAMYEKVVQQVTSLGGILTVVDKQLARNKNLVASVASIGQTVRHIYQDISTS
jgi:P-type conjugative transfer protein TrbJ